MLRPHALRVFVAVADCGNIRDAAAQLGRTVSAVSMTLKQLEDRIGAPLFEADRKHTLTPLGTEVRKLARDLLREHDRTMERITAIATGQEGVLRIAAVPSVAAQLLPAVLTEMLARQPGVQIELLDTDTPSVHALVAGGEVEIGIAGKPGPARDLEFMPLFNDPFRLVCRRDHPLAAATAPLRWQDLQGHRLISNKSTTDFATADDARLRAASALSARNMISLLALVGAGAGVTILPGLATRSMQPDLCSMALADRAALRTVGFILRQKNTPSPISTAFQRRFRKMIATSGLVSVTAAP
ncbi:LysR family transcriptional regulator [Rhodobacteraceae bacterium 2376]|uniref:LysR family transcriptional regulator n=1 Tax=Rhabdonatronobacter sediminivivens TaxID=2743469 RepID=A0A7Z0KXX9_9RHOB|nr:LysR family transcriptional regulator [Rhabdonatronobacter sediminivivens]NYS24755.1 LysR family transcriptional regulator [Rhabdonatronobacter sediminivivens]